MHDSKLDGCCTLCWTVISSFVKIHNSTNAIKPQSHKHCTTEMNLSQQSIYLHHFDDNSTGHSRSRILSLWSAARAVLGSFTPKDHIFSARRPYFFNILGPYIFVDRLFYTEDIIYSALRLYILRLTHYYH